MFTLIYDLVAGFVRDWRKQRRAVRLRQQEFEAKQWADVDRATRLRVR